LEFGEVFELDLVAEEVGVVALVWRGGGGGVEEDMLSRERGEVICIEVDSSAGEEEGGVDEMLTSVAWAGVLCVVGVLRGFVGFGVLLEAVEEDLVADLGWDAAVVEWGGFLEIHLKLAFMNWELLI